MVETSPHSRLLALPAELVYQVLGYLDPTDLARAARTCHGLRVPSYDDQIWAPLVNANVADPLSSPAPCKSFRELYLAHSPYWFLSRNRIWFADSLPSGKLLVARYNPGKACIEAFQVVAVRDEHTMSFWERDNNVILHDFDPHVSLDLAQPVLRLSADCQRTVDDRANGGHPSDRGYAPPSMYSKEVVMRIYKDPGLFAAFMLCKPLPTTAITEQTNVWPPLRFPSHTRVRNLSRDGYNSSGHRPTTLREVSHGQFRLRKWVEYFGRRSSPSVIFPSPNGLSAALGLRTDFPPQRITAGADGVMTIRMPEDINTYSTLPESCYTPTPSKPWQGIWVGDYSGHGCEFLLITQPSKEEESPLPDGLAWLREWFLSGRRGSSSSRSSYTSAQEVMEDDDLFDTHTPDDPEDPQRPHGASSRRRTGTQYGAPGAQDVPTGRLEAIKLTGDLNVPRGEYTWIAPDIGPGGFMRICEEEPFRGARVVRSAGHTADDGFQYDQYTRSQLIMVSDDFLAQYWECFGHISFYRRVNLDKLLRIQ